MSLFEIAEIEVICGSFSMVSATLRTCSFNERVKKRKARQFIHLGLNLVKTLDCSLQ